MTQARRILASIIVSAALLIAAWKGDWMVAVAFSTLFVFVLFPRWRGKVAALVERLLTWLTGKFKSDRCDRRD